MPATAKSIDRGEAWLGSEHRGRSKAVASVEEQAAGDDDGELARGRASASLMTASLRCRLPFHPVHLPLPVGRGGRGGAVPPRLAPHPAGPRPPVGAILRRRTPQEDQVRGELGTDPPSTAEEPSYGKEKPVLQPLCRRGRGRRGKLRMTPPTSPCGYTSATSTKRSECTGISVAVCHQRGGRRQPRAGLHIWLWLGLGGAWHNGMVSNRGER